MARVTDDAFAVALCDRFLVAGRQPGHGHPLHRSNVAAVCEYFGADGGTPFDGSRFESYSASAGEDLFRVTPADVVAVTLLSMEIRRESRSGISTAHLLAIEDRAVEITRLLRFLPADRDLHLLSDDDFDRLLGVGSPGRELWGLLRGEIGMHRVATFKLLARKRPRLCPIADSRTETALGSVDDWWQAWHRAVRSSADLVNELESVRRDVAREVPLAAGLSVLRVADIVLWHPWIRK